MAVLYGAPCWELTPRDEVWSQMVSYYRASGQLDPATVAEWGGDELGFYELGTEASYGSGWEQGPVADDAAWVGAWS